MNMRKEVSYIKRGHLSLIYIPWSVDKGLMLLVAVTVIIGPFTGIWSAVQIAIASAITFLSIYFTVCRFVGKWDYHKGTWAEESKLEFENNPEWQKKWSNMEAEVTELRHEVRQLRGNLTNILTQLRKATGE